MKHFANILAWLSILVILVGTATMGLFAFYYARDNYPDGEDSTGKWIKIGAYILWGLDGLFVLIVL